MFDKWTFLSLLILGTGLLIVAAPAQAQRLQPNLQTCEENPITLIVSSGTLDTLSEVCVERQSAMEVKTWAASRYTAWPSGWNSLEHGATLNVFRQSDEALVAGPTTAVKFQTTGVACPTLVFSEEDLVKAEGNHWYQKDPNDPGNPEMVQTMVYE